MEVFLVELGLIGGSPALREAAALRETILRANTIRKIIR